jgi:hypothetical protein
VKLHSRPSNAEAKKEERNTSTPPICLHGVNRDSSAFYMELTVYVVTIVAVRDSFNSVRYCNMYVIRGEIALYTAVLYL